MKLTHKKLKAWDACSEGVLWFNAQKESDVKKICVTLIKEKRADWANWLIARSLTRKQKIQYAIYAAEQVIGIYEKEYPGDKRPREAIRAAKNYLKNPSKKNKAAAYTAAYIAVDAAAYAANAAADAAASAAYAAANAAYAANAAANAAYAANAAAYTAANAAANAAAYTAASAAADAAAYAAAYAAADAANAAMKEKIIKYGLRLLYVKKK